MTSNAVGHQTSMDEVLKRMLSTPPAPQPGKTKPQPTDTKKTGQ